MMSAVLHWKYSRTCRSGVLWAVVCLKMCCFFYWPSGLHFQFCSTCTVGIKTFCSNLNSNNPVVDFGKDTFCTMVHGYSRINVNVAIYFPFSLFPWLHFAQRGKFQSLALQTLFTGSHKTPRSLSPPSHSDLFSLVCPLWRSGVSAMQGARQSALYFTCHCLTPSLSLLL